MPSVSAVVIVTQSDPRLGQMIQPVLNGLDTVKILKYWNLPENLHDIDGNHTYPLTLVGHANSHKFTQTYQTYDKISGSQLGNKLKSKELDIKRFPFCLIAGCNAAAGDADDALFAMVGEKLQIPVVASTTQVSMTAKGMYIELKPQDSGCWKVYCPQITDANPVFKLYDRPDIQQALSDYQFRCVTAD